MARNWQSVLTIRMLRVTLLPEITLKLWEDCYTYQRHCLYLLESNTSPSDHFKSLLYLPKTLPVPTRG